MGKSYAHTTTFPAIIRSTAQGPLDNRQVVNNRVDLLSSSTFEGAIYTGMIVVVLENKSVYFLNDDTKISDADYSGWTKLCDINEVTKKESELVGGTYIGVVESIAEDGHKVYTLNTVTKKVSESSETSTALATSYDVKSYAASKEELGTTNENVSSLSDRVDDLEESVKDYTVTISETDNSYVFNQCGEQIGTVYIPADKFVKSGSVVKGTWINNVFTPSETGTELALKLVLENSENPVYIDIRSISTNLFGFAGENITTTVNGNQIVAEITTNSPLANTITKVSGMEAGAQANKIESVTIDGVAQEITGKNVILNLENYATVNDSKVVIEEQTSQVYLRSYKFTQFGEEIGTVNISKSPVIESGSIVRGTWNGDVFTEDPAGPDKALKLTITGKPEAPIYINVSDLGHTYLGSIGDNIDITIGNDYKISATIHNNSDLSKTITKVSGIDSGAQVNKIEGIKVNNIDLTPDTDKKVNIDLSGYATNERVNTLESDLEDCEVTAATGFTDLNLRVSALEQSTPVSKVQSDWEETSTVSEAYIKNKPENLVQDADYSHITVSSTGGVSDNDGNVYKVEIPEPPEETFTGIQINSTDIEIVNKKSNIAVDGTYDESTNKVASVSTVTDAVNDKVDKTTTIAGIDLEDNITASELLLGINVAPGAQPNVIDSVSVNGIAQEIVDRNVNILIEDPEGFVTIEEFEESEYTTSKSINDLNTRVEDLESKEPEQNVQSDWTETDTTADSYIKNKPQHLVQDADYSHITVSPVDGVSDSNGNVYVAITETILDGVQINSTDLEIENKKVNIETTGTYSSENKIVTKDTLTSELSGKVDNTRTVVGKPLSADITKIDLLSALNVADGAQVNTIEHVLVNGTELTITDKTVDVIFPTNHATLDDLHRAEITASAGLNDLNQRLLVLENEDPRANVQSDWNETDTTKDSYIKNKPYVPHTYKQVVTSGSSVTIGNTSHGCGEYPIVQLYYDDEMVEGKVVVDSADKSSLTISWSSLITPSTEIPVIIRILG